MPSFFIRRAVPASCRYDRLPGGRVPVLRKLLLLAAVALWATPVFAADPPAADAPADAPAPTKPAAVVTRPEGAPAAVDTSQEAFRKEVMEEVRKELEKAKSDIQEEAHFVEAEADARNYDAEQLKALKETVNFLQLHGYFRLRGDLFTRADLGTGGTSSGGRTLFPASRGDPYLGVADMRLRLDPVIRVSDRIAIYSQIDVLDNAILGGNPATEPYFGLGSANVGAPILSSAVLAQPISLKRAWVEIQTPIGQVAFGRMPFHFGEGMVYNDGNCADCDFGTTFDRAQITTPPFLGGHLATITGAYLTQGITTQASETARAIPTEQLAAGYRFSLQLTRVVAPLELKRRIDNGEWVLQYGVLGAYRFQSWTSAQLQTNAQANTSGPILNNGNSALLLPLHAQFFETDAYLQALYKSLTLATEVSVFGGNTRDGISSTGVSIPGQSVDYLQAAAVIRGQYSFLKQNALLIGADVGYASGDNDHNGNMGARPWATTSDRGIYDGPVCSGACKGGVRNFRLNPDFRVDQLLWRNLFTTVTNAVYGRLEGRYKLGGRPSGGGENEGFEFGVSIIYSQAVFASATPSMTQAPLGVEFDPMITYLTHDRFYVGVVGGFLVPLGGLQIPNSPAPSLGQVYRGFAAVNF
jgi:uncharacterized protein (TIGR04551 family)